ncbi:MAG: ShlB/FhaC/HecB family hemolysin secretion/activation protein [Pseudomonadota bacterium]
MKPIYKNRLVGCTLLLLSSLAVANTSPGDAVGSFEIARYEVVGDSALGAAPIAQLLTPFTGKSRRFGDVQAAIDALEDAYRARGLSLVRVNLPEQELNQGTVRLVVTQTRIRKVQIIGNTRFDNANIRHSVPALVEGQTPQINRISASLRLANENPAKKTTISLQSAPNDDEVDATLQVVDEKPWMVGLSLDNAGSEATGKTQATAQFQHFNIAGLDHTLSLQYTTTLEHPNRVGVYGLGYHVPLYAWGDALDFYGSYSDVDSGTVSAGAFSLQVRGKGTVLGTRYTHNLARSENYASRISFGLEQKAFQNNLGFQGVQLGRDVTVRPFSAIYAGDWTHTAGATNYYLMGVRNLAGGNNGGESDFAANRAGAPANYGLLRYGLSHTRQFGSDWQVRAALNGQVSRDALVPGEQFGAGGATTVRGYNERVVSDDQGNVVNVEVYTPGLCSTSTPSAWQCRMLAFYDAAAVKRNNALPGERTDASLSSVGFGMRLGYGKSFSAQMDVGLALADSDTQSKGYKRVHIKMNLAY